jgi:two-component system, NarL family, nitrate/nitrite response regulator NarL
MSHNPTAVIVAPGVLLREGLASLLRDTAYEVAACATRPAELPRIPYSTSQWTLAIVGMDQKKENLSETVETIRMLRSSMPDGKVVLVAQSERLPEQQDILALSADSCIFNLGSRDTLIKVLELTLMGQRVFVFGESAAKSVSDPITPISSDDGDLDVVSASLPAGPYQRGTNSQSGLSPRECDILIGLAQGKSNKAIARLYNLSEATVKVHLKAILRKTRTQNRTQAAIWAIRQGFVHHSAKHSRLS